MLRVIIVIGVLQFRFLIITKVGGIMYETLLTMFDTQNPCWTKELFALAGEDESALDELEKAGFLLASDGTYCLTKKGSEKFLELKNELYIDELPGTASENPKLHTKRTKLRILLDKAHAQRWGIKEFTTGKTFRVWPKLERDKLFSLKNGLMWLYEESDVYKKMKAEFPHALTNGRRTDLVSPEKLESWVEENCKETDTLTADLLYLSRYDFIHYTNFKGHPNDPDRIINTDRFLFVFANEDMAENIETVGRFHLWLNTLRRMVIPGYTDRDTQEQDSVSWLLFVTDTEAEAVRLADELGAFGETLVKNANPFEVWTISLESLENVGETKEVIWELLPVTAHEAQRTVS